MNARYLNIIKKAIETLTKSPSLSGGWPTGSRAMFSLTSFSIRMVVVVDVEFARWAVMVAVDHGTKQVLQVPRPECGAAVDVWSRWFRGRRGGVARVFIDDCWADRFVLV